MFSDVEVAVILQSARNEVALEKQAQGIINDKVATIKSLRRQVEVLQAALIKEIAFGAGSKAQVRAFIEQYPDSPLMRATGKQYADGRIQRVVTTVFEKAFDEKARELGVADPTQIRDVAR
jgi:hypothetical protein